MIDFVFDQKEMIAPKGINQMNQIQKVNKIYGMN